MFSHSRPPQILDGPGGGSIDAETGAFRYEPRKDRGSPAERARARRVEFTFAVTDMAQARDVAALRIRVTPPSEGDSDFLSDSDYPGRCTSAV
eukprot:1187481-Prorocentrum_minimum.AAC.1